MKMRTESFVVRDEAQRVAESLRRETSRELYFRVWVIRLGIATAIVMMGWGIYLGIVIKRLLQ
jgi:hypothetical protein